MNARLSPDTRLFLENLVANQGGHSSHVVIFGGQQDSVEERSLSRTDSTSSYGPGIREVEVRLSL